MAKFFYLMTLVTQFDEQYSTAMTQTRYALLQTPEIQQDISQLKGFAEQSLYNATGLTPADLAYGAYVYPLISGKISSKPFKHFNYRMENGALIVPEIEYNFRNDTSSIGLSIVKSF